MPDMDSYEQDINLLDFPDEVLVNILSYIPRLDLFWCAGLACTKLFSLSCDMLDNTIELRESTSVDEMSQNIMGDLRHADRLDEIFRTRKALDCISHIIIPSISPNFAGKR